ncbi:MAG: AlpA family phage regulatory protein [Altererythrobacter sp.]|nr:AlpA family phage regulatory protein [Altererythrobacter sp.]
MSNIELLTCHEVMRLTGIRSRTTIWRRIRRGAFPHPIDIGGGRVRRQHQWHRFEVVI